MGPNKLLHVVISNSHCKCFYARQNLSIQFIPENHRDIPEMLIQGSTRNNWCLYNEAPQYILHSNKNKTLNLHFRSTAHNLTTVKFTFTHLNSCQLFQKCGEGTALLLTKIFYPRGAGLNQWGKSVKSYIPKTESCTVEDKTLLDTYRAMIQEYHWTQSKTIVFKFDNY